MRDWETLWSAIASGLITSAASIYAASLFGEGHTLERYTWHIMGLCWGVGGAVLAKQTLEDEYYADAFQDAEKLIFQEHQKRRMMELLAPPEPVQVEAESLPALPAAGVENRAFNVKRIEEVLDLKDPKKRELFNYLAQPQYRWILQLMMTSPLAIIGPQCSGKTTFASFLMLLRMAFLNVSGEINDPHAHQNNWPNTYFPVRGHHQNWSEIVERMEAFKQRMITHEGSNSDRRIHYQSYWDEFTTYGENIDDGKKNKENIGQKFMMSALSETSKGGELITLLAHGWTQAATGKSSGTAKMKDEGFVRVELFNYRDELGKLRPKLEGRLIGLNRGARNEPLEEMIALENWMTPQYIVNLLGHCLTPLTSVTPDNTEIQLDSYSEPVEPREGKSETYRNILENLVKSEPVEENYPDLPKPLQLIVELSQKKGWISARDVRIGKNHFKSVSAEDIKAMFFDLRNRGVGAVRDEEGNPEFNVNPYE